MEFWKWSRLWTGWSKGIHLFYKVVWRGRLNENCKLDNWKLVSSTEWEMCSCDYCVNKIHSLEPQRKLGGCICAKLSWFLSSGGNPFPSLKNSHKYYFLRLNSTQDLSYLAFGLAFKSSFTRCGTASEEEDHIWWTTIIIATCKKKDCLTDKFGRICFASKYMVFVSFSLQ